MPTATPGIVTSPERFPLWIAWVTVKTTFGPGIRTTKAPAITNEIQIIIDHLLNTFLKNFADKVITKPNLDIFI